LSILNSRPEIQVNDKQGNPVVLPAALVLLRLGPRVIITLSPLDAQLRTFADKGESPPAPVTGWALIDTGASVTCVDRNAAERAGLAMVDSGPMTSATHDNEIVPIFAGRTKLENLPQPLDAKHAYGANLEPQGIIALIGRDALSVCVLVYNGLDGSFSLSI